MTLRTTKAVLDHILRDIRDEYQRKGDKAKVPTASLITLTSLFDDPGPALKLAQDEKVSLMRTHEGREIYKIESEVREDIYYCFKNSFYCTCPAYEFQVAHKKQTLFCKHIIACRLADAMNMVRHQYIDNSELFEILSSTARRVSNDGSSSPLPFSEIDSLNITGCTLNDEKENGGPFTPMSIN